MMRRWVAGQSTVWNSLRRSSSKSSIEWRPPARLFLHAHAQGTSTTAFAFPDLSSRLFGGAVRRKLSFTQPFCPCMDQRYYSRTTISDGRSPKTSLRHMHVHWVHIWSCRPSVRVSSVKVGLPRPKCPAVGISRPDWAD